MQLRPQTEVGTMFEGFDAKVTQIVDWMDRHHLNIVPVIGTLVVLILAALIILILTRLLRRWLAYIHPRLQLTYETSLTISRIVSAVLWIVTIFIVLTVWGANLGGVWAVFASAMTLIGVGFLATWAMVSNMTANFFLAVWRPFHFGQTVEILPENLKGRVTDRNLMFTTLREDSGSVLQIPNNLFFQKMFRVSGQAAIGAQDLRDHADAASLAPAGRSSSPAPPRNAS
jgi:small-conductance mechanosensitive channel